MTDQSPIDFDTAQARCGDTPVVYDGLDWSRISRSTDESWSATSPTTGLQYLVTQIDEGVWSARQGFSNLPGKPFMEISRHPDRALAMTASERHDFRFWRSVHDRAGNRVIFSGSPDHVADFIKLLDPDAEQDVLDVIAGGFSLPDGQNFAHVASFFPCRKSAMKQERNGDYSVTLTVAAQDLPIWLINAAPGSGLVAGIHPTGEDPSENWSERAARALRRSFALPQDNTFQAWLSQKYDKWNLISTALGHDSEAVERACTETLRRLIGCPSRADLARNRDAIMRIEKIDREFFLDMSRGYTPQA